MNIQYILHADVELPGIIEVWAKQNMFDANFCRPFAGDRLPAPKDFDLLILMGGPQDLGRKEESAYLLEEIALIRQSIESKKPILGICLGAQLIGEACGAATERSPNKEVGVFPIELTDEGMKDPLLKGLPKQFSVIHWHNDMPGIPPGAAVLASSHGCPRQIIRYTPLTYGFQCHPEPMMTNVEAMIKEFPNDLTPGTYVQTSAQFLNHDFGAINQTMIHILDNLKHMIK